MMFDFGLLAVERDRIGWWLAFGDGSWWRGAFTIDWYARQPRRLR